MFPLFRCAASNALAVAVIIKRISLKGSLVFDIKMAFLRAGAGMKIAEPLWPIPMFLSGAWISSTFWAVVQSESSWTVGTTILQSGAYLTSDATASLVASTIDKGKRKSKSQGKGKKKSKSFTSEKGGAVGHIIPSS